MSCLFRNLLHFSRLLRDLDLHVPAGRMPVVAAALEHIDIGQRWDFYYTLRTLLVHRQQDLAAFDEAFRVFWRRPPSDWSTQDLRAMGEERKFGPPQVDFPFQGPDGAGDDPNVSTLPDPVSRTVPLSYSPDAISRVKDFAEFTEAELDQARKTLAAMGWELGMRRTRRWVTGEGTSIDLRRTIHHNVRFGGEVLELRKRTRKDRRRPLVLLCDVSGSMDRYSRMLLHFIYSLSGAMDRVEAFLFATELTRVTREMSAHKEDAFSRIPRHVPDWAGGTRIGETLRTFNLQWSRRVMSHGPVVLLISDGWDRGEPGLLSREISRLQRSCYRLIWLNPLLGSPDYQPLTRGMEAALPFVDDFLPMHNLASMEALAHHLNTLPRRRQRGHMRVGLSAEKVIGC